MKLDFHRIGVKLFFVTVVVDGRKELLSRVEDEQARPELQPLGELVRAALRSMHLVREAVGVSDYVIMPDHFHFLMVLDCARDARLSPLWYTHRLLDAIERAAAGGEAQAGEIAPEILTQYLEEACLEPTGASPCTPAPPAIFERSPYLELSFDSRQLKAMRRYIKLNPARRLWKLRHPDMFQRMTGLRHLFLDAAYSWSAIGNATLFASPLLFHVRLTLKKTAEEHQSAIDEIVEKSKRGYIPVSGFISSGVREALRRLKAEPRARFIKLLPYALPARYDPSAEDSRELAAGRMLILSGFSSTPAIPSLEMKKDSAAAHRFRANCLAMNDLGAALCQAAQCGGAGVSPVDSK